MSIGVEDSRTSASGGFVGGVVGLLVVDPLGVDVVGVVLLVDAEVNPLDGGVAGVVLLVGGEVDHLGGVEVGLLKVDPLGGVEVADVVLLVEVVVLVGGVELLGVIRPP